MIGAVVVKAVGSVSGKHAAKKKKQKTKKKTTTTTTTFKRKECGMCENNPNKSIQHGQGENKKN